MFITRRQFLKYCAASAAALGLSQTDLLHLEQAMATPVTACSPGTGLDIGLGPLPVPRIIWIAGANCSGCATGLLNFLAPEAGFSPFCDTSPGNEGKLVSETWVETEPALGALYPVAGAIDAANPFYNNSAIDIGDVAINVVSIDWAYIVAAGAGDILNEQMFQCINAGSFVLMIEGSIQIKKEGLYCRIFEVPPGRTVTIPSTCKYYDGTHAGFPAGKTLNAGDDVTMADGAAYLASHSHCLAVIAFGTCATWGGIPAAKGNKTNAISVEEWLVKKNQLTVDILNVPGCPPHPDWLIAPVVDLILRLYGHPSFPGGKPGWLANIDTTLCTRKPKDDPSVEQLTAENRHKLTWKPIFKPGRSFCIPENNVKLCPRTGLETPEDITGCGRDATHPDGRCLRGVGCCGWKTQAIGAKADCYSRMFNTHTNWCVGNNFPCQGCTDPNFPDGCAPFFSQQKGKFRGVL